MISFILNPFNVCNYSYIQLVFSGDLAVLELVEGERRKVIPLLLGHDVIVVPELAEGERDEHGRDEVGEGVVQVHVLISCVHFIVVYYANFICCFYASLSN